MINWYYRVTADVDNWHQPLADALEHYYKEYEQAQTEMNPERGRTITDYSGKLPGMVEYRNSQHAEIEGIMKFLEMRYEKAKIEKKKQFLEHYNRSLTDKVAEQYADIDPDVLVIREYIQQVALIRNKFLSINSGLSSMNYQISNISRLRIAGIEDSTFF